ncbi:MAG: hypothetical protein ACRET2_07275 [Steroidobacteraceae bacterium]
MAVPVALAQTAATQPAAAQPAAAQLAVVKSTADAARPSRRTPSHHPRSRPTPGTAHRSVTASTAAGVTLGATDITGNKELPKVMVIVPWKDSLGASGVVKPTDSLLDEVLQPVDRGVFQRQIHYYGQLQAGERPARGKLAPVGDSH